MARLTRMERLQNDAKAAGLIVATYSPGDGVTRYRFFVASEQAHVRHADYFGGSRPVETVLGIAKAEQFVSDYAERQNYASRARRDEVLISAASKPTMADVRAADAEHHRRRGDGFTFFSNKPRSQSEKFHGPYAGPGGIFFVMVSKSRDGGHIEATIRQVMPTGEIRTPASGFKSFHHVEDARDAAKAMAKGTRAAASNPSRRRR